MVGINMTTEYRPNLICPTFVSSLPALVNRNSFLFKINLCCYTEITLFQGVPEINYTVKVSICVRHVYEDVGLPTGNVRQKPLVTVTNNDDFQTPTT